MQLTVAGFAREENARRHRLRSVQPDNGSVLRQRLFHNLRGAALARGGFAIPDGDEKVGLFKHDAPDAFISGGFRVARTVGLKDRGGSGK